MNPDSLKSGDNDDLQALFDSIAEQQDAGGAPVKPAASASSEPADGAVTLGSAEEPDPNDPMDVFRRVGTLTRKLHDALRQLGYDKNVENAVNSLPDARARLSYIADLTGKAADKVLAAVEHSQRANDALAEKARVLDAQWDRLYNQDMSLEEFKEHAQKSREFVKQVGLGTSEMGGHLTEILMAQDFHDLTGQVVNRIANMVHGLEEQLVRLLLDTTPKEQRKQVEETWLSGPAINSEARTDVCANQTQVDDLLESLGF